MLRWPWQPCKPRYRAPHPHMSPFISHPALISYVWTFAVLSVWTTPDVGRGNCVAGITPEVHPHGPQLHRSEHQDDGGWAGYRHATRQT